LGIFREAPPDTRRQWTQYHLATANSAVRCRSRAANLANPIPRPEFSGNRINLTFYDLMDGANIATASHIEEVYRFSERWAKAAHSDPATANLVVHCLAGISRSSAIAMILLLLYYRSEKAAAKRLYEINRWAAPNTHILYLIEEKFSSSRKSPWRD
jgi:predicted protein tyrosine phosphatase